MKKGSRLWILGLLSLTTACAGSTPSPTPLTPSPWIEEEVSFSFGATQLYGILTLPAGGGPYPAIVLVSGSIGTSTGVRSGVLSLYLAVVGQTLLEDPGEYWTKVQCPVLAVWGEDDLLQPTARSARLYEYYLMQAGNERLKKVVIPGVGHSISVSTPGYWEELSKWLDELYPE